MGVYDKIPLKASVLTGCNTYVLGHFSVLENDEKEILIVLPIDDETEVDPEKSVFYYDGGEHGILAKNMDTVIICDDIHEEVRKTLTACKKVIFAEMIPRESVFSREYEVDLCNQYPMQSLATYLINKYEFTQSRKSEADNEEELEIWEMEDGDPWDD